MLILYQSSEKSRPWIQRGLKTRPTVRVLLYSGSRSALPTPAWNGALPWVSRAVTGTPALSVWRKVGARPSPAQRAAATGLASWPKRASHGSVRSSKVCEPPPKVSSRVGARKPLP
ncbi:hypothetical protein D3C71_1374970 [compost metagenome]